MQASLLHSTPVHGVEGAQVWPLSSQDAVHRVFAVLPRYMHRHAVGLAHRHRIGRLAHDLQDGNGVGRAVILSRDLGSAGQPQGVHCADQQTGNIRRTDHTCQPAATGNHNKVSARMSALSRQPRTWMGPAGTGGSWRWMKWRMRCPSLSGVSAVTCT